MDCSFETLNAAYAPYDEWPGNFGFSIHGKGPSYIIKVLSGTVAEASGLKAGDQVLQVNEHDVSGWAAEDIISLVSRLPQLPPSLGVVSRLKEITLTPSSTTREFGFSLIGTFPVKIQQIKPGSPSDEANLSRNDLIVKIDGDMITSLVQARRLADNAVRNGGIKLAVIPAPSSLPNTLTKQPLPTRSKVREYVKHFEAPRTGQIKAQSFIEKIKEILHDRPAVVEGIVRSIKQYSEERHIEPLVFTLCAILDPPEERKILEELRIFIPRQHKIRYDTLVKKALSKKNSELKNSRLKNFNRNSPLPPVGYRHAIIQHDGGHRSFVATIRQINVFRRGLSFGITLRGESPVQVQSVDKGSPAERAGLETGDELLSLNGLDISTVPHERAIALLQGSGSMPTLVIQTTSGALAPPGTSLLQMPCHISPAIDPKIFTTLENMSVTSKSQGGASDSARDQNNNNNNKDKGNVTKNTKPHSKVTKIDPTWTQKFVPPDFKVHGETFDQHLYNLLMPSERRVVKKALENNAENRNIDTLLEVINPILDNPNKWPIWYFIVQSLSGRERVMCRRKLAELLQKQAQDDALESNEPNKCVNSEGTGTAKARIRRRRTMKASYNRSQTTDCMPSMASLPDADSNPEDGGTRDETEVEETPFRVRRTRRRRTVSGVVLSSPNFEEEYSRDILRIDEPEDKLTHLPSCTTQEITQDMVFKRTERFAENSSRRRRRDPMLRRLQSADGAEAKEISLERDALIQRNSAPTTPTPQATKTSLGRERRRRSFRESLDGAVGHKRGPMGSHERAALVVRRRSQNSESRAREEIPETDIDLVEIEGSPPRAETARRRRRTPQNSASSRDRSAVPITSIDEVLLSTENANNNNINKLYLPSADEDTCGHTTDEHDDSDMSMKSPLSMSRLRSSFRISSKSKNKEDTNTSSNDEKSKSKKSGGRGLLERMGMGKKQPSGSDSSSKDESKSKKLFGRSKSSKKEEAKAKQSVDTQTKSTTEQAFTAPAAPVNIINSGVEKSSAPQMKDPAMDMGNQTSPVLIQDEERTNGFMMRNIKKRLTFSRPPINSDTKAFLNELSSQFDNELEILDDLLTLEEKNNKNSQFGSKWSYLPNGKMTDAPEGDDMSDLGLSDIEDTTETIPPFPLNLDSGDESGVGTVETLSSPSPTTIQTRDLRDRELEWERERLKRKKSRRQAFESLTSQPDDGVKSSSVNMRSRNGNNRNPPLNRSQTTNDTMHDDDVIYDVPKMTRRTRGTRKSRREALSSRSISSPAKVSTPPMTQVTRLQGRFRGLIPEPTDNDNNYVDMLQTTHIDQVTHDGSPPEQSFFDRAKQRGYRVSGVSMDMGNVFSAAEESLQHEDVVDSVARVQDHSVGIDTQTTTDNDFAGEVKTQRRSRRRRGPESVTHLASDSYLYVDEDGVYTQPRSSTSTAVKLRKRSLTSDSSQPEVDLEGDLSFTDINALLQAYDDEDGSDEQPPEIPPLPDSETPPPIPPPPPPPIPPPPPSIPPPPPLMSSSGPTSPVRMNVKRINWQKIEPSHLEETVWGQIGEDYDTINDVVKYLDLEQHFATKKSRELKRMSLPVRRDVVSILSHKKAYNTAILLAHLKMTVSELRGVLLSVNDRRLDSSQYKTMLMYAPDDDEATKLLVYNGDVTKLNEADQFAKRMVKIPGYRLRLQALVFKQSFSDREEDVRKNLESLQQASIQLRKSKKLAKILEFVLAMGNYMNRGHNRISKATGFKIQFLADMDSTKTSDNKLTFLHILARAVYSKFPELCNFAQDLKDVRPASRVTYPMVFQELQEMRKEWVEIRDRMPETLTNKVRGDRFKLVMENCLVQTNSALKRLELLLASTMKEFSKTARYFGENAKTVAMQQFFSIFGEFIWKFEKADKEIKFIMKNKSTTIEST